jgi:hypothetical protein
MKIIHQLTESQLDLFIKCGTVVDLGNEKWYNLPQWFVTDYKGLNVEVPADEVPAQVKMLIVPDCRTFSLKEMMDAWDAGFRKCQSNEEDWDAGGDGDTHTPTKKEYFKETFGITI